MEGGTKRFIYNRKHFSDRLYSSSIWPGFLFLCMAYPVHIKLLPWRSGVRFNTVPKTGPKIVPEIVPKNPSNVQLKIQKIGVSTVREFGTFLGTIFGPVFWTVLNRIPGGRFNRKKLVSGQFWGHFWGQFSGQNSGKLVYAFKKLRHKSFSILHLGPVFGPTFGPKFISIESGPWPI